MAAIVLDGLDHAQLGHEHTDETVKHIDGDLAQIVKGLIANEGAAGV